MLSDQTQRPKPLTLPALRGTFGDWTYYSALLPLADLATRVSFADEIHKNKALSDLIQRSLKGGKAGSRAKDIAAYLRDQDERFFNSLVIAVYGGKPEWFPVRIVKSDSEMPEPPDTEGILGALRLSGEELLFAVDGQHRLAGMKRLVLESHHGKAPAALTDLVSALFISHRTDKLVRTRRLFTTLNKTAVPASKMERIALDENDAMAITVRRLVEEHPFFSGPRIAMNHTNNLGNDDDVALTTLGNLYDILRVIFLAMPGKKRKALEYERPSDPELNGYYSAAVDFFKDLSRIDPAISAYFSAESVKDLRKICAANRNRKGGSVSFRPIGLAILAEVAMSLKARGRNDWATIMSRLPLHLAKIPYRGTIWTEQSTIQPKNRVLCRNIPAYMCGDTKVSASSIRARLAEVNGKREDDVVLPARVSLAR